MKVYDLKTCFRFGKHINKTLEEVFAVDPGYINWCLIFLDHFLIAESAFLHFQRPENKFEFSKGAQTKYTVKRQKIESSCDYEIDKESYGKYAGTYAQEQEWLSDDFIDDVLDGFPDAYWNID